MKVKLSASFRKQLQTSLQSSGDVVLDIDKATADRWVAEAKALAVSGASQTPDLSAYRRRLVQVTRDRRR